VRIKEISGLLHSKSFGEKKARKIERLCNLPIGWLDHEDDPILPSHGFAPVSVVDSEDPNFIEIRKIKLRLSAGISVLPSIKMKKMADCA
jgi:hypothetical protein